MNLPPLVDPIDLGVENQQRFKKCRILTGDSIFPALFITSIEQLIIKKCFNFAFEVFFGIMFEISQSLEITSIESSKRAIAEFTCTMQSQKLSSFRSLQRVPHFFEIINEIGSYFNMSLDLKSFESLKNIFKSVKVNFLLSDNVFEKVDNNSDQYYSTHLIYLSNGRLLLMMEVSDFMDEEALMAEEKLRKEQLEVQLRLKNERKLKKQAEKEAKKQAELGLMREEERRNLFHFKKEKDQTVETSFLLAKEDFLCKDFTKNQEKVRKIQEQIMKNEEILTRELIRKELKREMAEDGLMKAAERESKIFANKENRKIRKENGLIGGEDKLRNRFCGIEGRVVSEELDYMRNEENRGKIIKNIAKSGEDGTRKQENKHEKYLSQFLYDQRKSAKTCVKVLRKFEKNWDEFKFLEKKTEKKARKNMRIKEADSKNFIEDQNYLNDVVVKYLKKLEHQIAGYTKKEKLLSQSEFEFLNRDEKLMKRFDKVKAKLEGKIENLLAGDDSLMKEFLKSSSEAAEKNQAFLDSGENLIINFCNKEENIRLLVSNELDTDEKHMLKFCRKEGQKNKSQIRSMKKQENHLGKFYKAQLLSENNETCVLETLENEKLEFMNREKLLNEAELQVLTKNERELKEHFILQKDLQEMANQLMIKEFDYRLNFIKREDGTSCNMIELLDKEFTLTVKFSKNLHEVKNGLSSNLLQFDDETKQFNEYEKSLSKKVKNNLKNEMKMKIRFANSEKRLENKQICRLDIEENLSIKFYSSEDTYKSYYLESLKKSEVYHKEVLDKISSLSKCLERGIRENEKFSLEFYNKEKELEDKCRLIIGNELKNRLAYDESGKEINHESSRILDKEFSMTLDFNKRQNILKEKNMKKMNEFDIKQREFDDSEKNYSDTIKKSLNHEMKLILNFLESSQRLEKIQEHKLGSEETLRRSFEVQEKKHSSMFIEVIEKEDISLREHDRASKNKENSSYRMLSVIDKETSRIISELNEKSKEASKGLKFDDIYLSGFIKNECSSRRKNLSLLNDCDEERKKFDVNENVLEKHSRKMLRVHDRYNKNYTRSQHSSELLLIDRLSKEDVITDAHFNLQGKLINQSEIALEFHEKKTIEFYRKENLLRQSVQLTLKKNEKITKNFIKKSNKLREIASVSMGIIDNLIHKFVLDALSNSVYASEIMNSEESLLREFSNNEYLNQLNTISCIAIADKRTNDFEIDLSRSLKKNRKLLSDNEKKYRTFRELENKVQEFHLKFLPLEEQLTSTINKKGRRIMRSIVKSLKNEETRIESYIKNQKYHESLVIKFLDPADSLAISFSIFLKKSSNRISEKIYFLDSLTIDYNTKLLAIEQLISYSLCDQDEILKRFIKKEERIRKKNEKSLFKQEKHMKRYISITENLKHLTSECLEIDDTHMHTYICEEIFYNENIETIMSAEDKKLKNYNEREIKLSLKVEKILDSADSQMKQFTSKQNLRNRIESKSLKHEDNKNLNFIQFHQKILKNQLSSLIHEEKIRKKYEEFLLKKTHDIVKKLSLLDTYFNDFNNSKHYFEDCVQRSLILSNDERLNFMKNQANKMMRELKNFKLSDKDLAEFYIKQRELEKLTLVRLECEDGFGKGYEKTKKIIESLVHSQLNKYEKLAFVIKEHRQSNELESISILKFEEEITQVFQSRQSGKRKCHNKSFKFNYKKSKLLSSSQNKLEASAVLRLEREDELIKSYLQSLSSLNKSTSKQLSCHDSIVKSFIETETSGVNEELSLMIKEELSRKLHLKDLAKFKESTRKSMKHNEDLSKTVGKKQKNQETATNKSLNKSYQQVYSFCRLQQKQQDQTISKLTRDFDFRRRYLKSERETMEDLLSTLEKEEKFIRKYEKELKLMDEEERKRKEEEERYLSSLKRVEIQRIAAKQRLTREKTMRLERLNSIRQAELERKKTEEEFKAQDDFNMEESESDPIITEDLLQREHEIIEKLVLICGSIFCSPCYRMLRRSSLFLKCDKCCSAAFKTQETPTNSKCERPKLPPGSICVGCDSVIKSRGEIVQCICCYIKQEFLKDYSPIACGGCNHPDYVSWVDTYIGASYEMMNCGFCDRKVNYQYLIEICTNCHDQICLHCLRKNNYLSISVCNECHSRRQANPYKRMQKRQSFNN